MKCAINQEFVMECAINQEFVMECAINPEFGMKCAINPEFGLKCVINPESGIKCALWSSSQQSLHVKTVHTAVQLWAHRRSFLVQRTCLVEDMGYSLSIIMTCSLDLLLCFPMLTDEALFQASCFCLSLHCV